MPVSKVRRSILLFLAAAFTLNVLGILYYAVVYQSPLISPATAIRTFWNGPSLVVRSVADPAMVEAGLKADDRVLSVVDARGRKRSIRGQYDIWAAARMVRFGEPYALNVQRSVEKGEPETLHLAMPPVQRPDISLGSRFMGFLPALFFNLVCLLTALFIGFSKLDDDNAFTASILFFCIASLSWGSVAAIFPPGLREAGIILWIMLLSTMTATFMRFFLLFPSPSILDRRLPWLKKAGVAFGLFFGLWNLAWHFTQFSNRETFIRYFGPVRWLDILQDSLFCLLFIIGIVSLALNIVHLKAPDDRRRLIILLCGSLGVLPWLMVYLYTVTVDNIALPYWFFVFRAIALILFPAAFFYVVVKHRIFGLSVILRRGLQYALLSKGVLFLEGILILVGFYYATGPYLARILLRAGHGFVAVAIATATAGTVLGIRQVNRRVMPHIERRFFREAYDARRILSDLAMSVRQLVWDTDALIGTVTRTVSEALHPDEVAVFLRAGDLASLPSDSEVHRRIRRTAADLHSGDFLCCWRRRKSPAGRGEGEGDCVPPVRLPDGGLVAKLLRESLEDGRLVDVDPKNTRSRAPFIDTQGSPEEKRTLNGMNARLLIPLASDKDLLGFISLGEKLSEEPYSREDMDLLLALAQQTADTLDHARLLRQGQEQAQLQREVEIAMQVQENLLPQGVIPVANIEYAGICKPARYVGGDYYDFIRRGEGSLGIALADISGKGVSAALLMASLQATLRIQVDTHGADLEEIMSGINRRMCAATAESRFATLFYGVFDSRKRTLDYINAGHNPPLIFRSGKDGKEIIRLKSSGTVLGIFPNLTYKQQSVQLLPDDVLVVFSDGVVEAVNDSNQFYEEERLEALVPQLSDLSAEAIRDRILEDVAHFAGAAPQNDDITLITARIL